MTKFSNADYYKLLNENLSVLVNNGKIGFCKLQSGDIRAKPNKFLELTQGTINYHFCVDIPYAGRILNWEIIFDPEEFSELPDFDFNDYSFLPEPDINYIAENVPSWDTWNLADSQAVLNILNEFLVLYKRAQVEKLSKQSKFSDLKVQYEDLLTSLDLSPDNVEIHIEGKKEYDNEDAVLVCFLIILPIDFSQLPEYYQENNEQLLNPGEDFAHLNIQMKKLDNSQTKILLTVSPRAEQLFGKLKLPKYRKDSTLAEYARAVQTNIDNQIKLICEQHEARSLFVASIVDSFPSGIVEYDSKRFYKVTFRYEDCEEYDCLVSVILGGKFPQERPKIQLHSVYCQLGKNCSTNVIFHSYDPQAAQQENVQALRDVLHGDVKIFQNHKH